LLPEFLGFREPLLSAVGVAGAASGGGLLAARAGEQVRSAGRWLVRRSGRVIAVGAVVFLAYFLTFALLRHFSLRSGSSDLAWENQVLYNIATTGRAFSSVGPYVGCYFQDHVPLVYYLLAPFYRLAPAPETFILLQVLILAAGAPVLWGYVRAVTGSRLAAVLAGLAYLLHPCVHGMAVFDVHASPLAIPFVLGAGWAFCRERNLLGWMLLLVGMSCREEMTLAGLVLGMALLSRRRWRTCLALVVVALLANRLIAGELMTAFGGSPNYDRFPFFQDEKGMVGLWPLATKFAAAPWETTAHFLRAPKLAYLVVMLLPLGFLPVCTWRFVLAAGPGLFLTLGASYPGHYIAGYQYGTLLLLAILLCFPLGWRIVAGWRRRRRRGALMLGWGILCAAVLSNYLWGNFFGQNYIVDYVDPQAGPGTYLRQLGAYDRWPFDPARVGDVRAVRRMVPAEAKVAASFYLVPHFSSRPWVTAVERGHALQADYLVLDPSSLLPRDRRVLGRLLPDFQPLAARGPIKLYCRRRDAGGLQAPKSF